MSKDECKKLNDYCMQDCIFVKDKKNIRKIFRLKNVFEWELYIYKNIQSIDILPEVQIVNTESQKEIIYNTDKLISLRTFLKKRGINKSMIFQELFSYIKTFRQYSFIHGNLNIDNIFLTSKFHITPRFYIIDYANSYLVSRNSWPSYKRLSFIGGWDEKLGFENFLYWDYLTIFISLKKNISKNEQLRVESIIDNFVHVDILKKLIEEYYKNWNGEKSFIET